MVSEMDDEGYDGIRDENKWLVRWMMMKDMMEEVNRDNC